LWWSEILSILKRSGKDLGPNQKRIKTRTYGKFFMTAASILVNREIKHIIPFVNQELRIKSDDDLIEAMRRVENLHLKELDESLVEMA
jgi:hypothetical protein